MTPQEIINVIKAFFDAIIRVFEALGIMKKDEAAEDEGTTAQA